MHLRGIGEGCLYAIGQRFRSPHVGRLSSGKWKLTEHPVYDANVILCEVKVLQRDGAIAQILAHRLVDKHGAGAESRQPEHVLVGLAGEVGLWRVTRGE